MACDNNGNLAGWQGEGGEETTRRGMFWDEENRLQQVNTAGQVPSTYRYDDGTTRVVKVTPEGETHTANQWFVSSGDKVSKHVFAGATRIASTVEGPVGPATFYYHPDHLGSSSMVSDQNGAIYQHLAYFPFGETWIDQKRSSDEGVPYRYTAKEWDEDTKLYYYGARYYDPRLSLWTAPDPAMGEYLPTTDKVGNAGGKVGLQLPELETNWQTCVEGLGCGASFEPKNLSTFAYAQQNPIKFNDPDGRGAVGFFVKVTKIFVTKEKKVVQYDVKKPLATQKQAVNSRKNGKNVFVEGKNRNAPESRKAKRVEQQATGKNNTVRHDPHRNSDLKDSSDTRPHYQPDKRRSGASGLGHTMYSTLGGLTAVGTLDEDAWVVDRYLSNVVDFFNPASSAQDLVGLAIGIDEDDADNDHGESRTQGEGEDE